MLTSCSSFLDDDDEPLDAHRVVRPLEGKKIILYDPESFDRLSENTSGQTRPSQYFGACLLPVLLILSRVYI
jgi:hypothetical protein